MTSSLCPFFIIFQSFYWIFSQCKPTISHIYYWDSLYFYERLAQRYPYLLVQCCANSGKAMPCSGGQEWANKLATNIATKPSLTGFWCRSYESATFGKLIFSVLQSLCFYRARFHGLPYALPYMSPYFYENLEPHLLVAIFNTLPEVSLNVIQHIFSKICR